MTIAISLDSVCKNFGDFTAIKDVSFDIADNEFFTLLGPSGCGKTTLLRMIAGFENISSGKILLYDEEIEDLPPNKRSVNTVFQNYALFPHMSVTENIRFGLEMLGWQKVEIDKRVAQMIDTVQLQEFAHRKPSQMSGGQQQRVALARAMAPRPKVLLLDEPLSALDLKLRQEMRSELKRIQKEIGITFIFVTHDQEEALSMSDRIAVMSAGNVQQIGTPTEIYEYPANRFVADFIGDINLLAAKVEKSDKSTTTWQLDGGTMLTMQTDEKLSVGQNGYVSIRPEHLTISTTELKAKTKANCLEGSFAASTYLGTDIQIETYLNDKLSLSSRMQNGTFTNGALKKGDRVIISIADNAVRFLVE